MAFFSKGGHLYRYATSGKAVTDLTPGGGLEGMLGASPDGAYAYYQTPGGIFLDHAGTTTPVSASGDASNYPPATGSARVAPDGQTLAFVSSADLSDFNSFGTPEVFLYTTSGGVICASCNPSSEPPIGPASLPGAYANGAAYTGYKPRALVDDGNRLFFDTGDTLSNLDTNRHSDVYQWEADGTGSCATAAGCLSLISSGDEATATFVDASADGSDLFFNTDGSLVRNDPGSADIYDARVGGGLPVPEDPIVCVGDSCQALPPEPEDPKPGTIIEGLGNPAPRTPPKAKPKKKKKHKHSKHKRNHRGQSSRAGGSK